MADNDALLWSHVPPMLTHAPRPSEPLFSFIRASDGASMMCVLRFNGESCGWEALFLERSELSCSRGGFATRAAAVEWADAERESIRAESAWRPSYDV